MDNTWIVLGTSASASAMLPIAMTDYPDATTITTNSGIDLIVPDYYFLSDHIACEWHGAKANQYKAEHGMKLVSLNREIRALQTRGVDQADYLLEISRNHKPGVFCRNIFTDCMFSGLFTAQFAIYSGATTLAIVGHEGYPWRGNQDIYFDGNANSHPVHQRQKITTTRLAPWWQGAVTECGDITFHFYGNLNFEITGSNIKRTLAHENQTTARVA